MKKLISIAICLFLNIIVFAQEGVNFRDLTYEEALAAAKAEKKMLFVDCYTSWCGPCKMMTNQVFPQKEAGDYFNSRFVCVKYDMEKGEGKELGEKWDVRAYPTFLMIRPDGEIQHMVVGGCELQEFIKMVDKGTKKKTSLKYLQERYEQGKITKKELLSYGVALRESSQGKALEKVRGELMEILSDKEKVKAECWPLFQSAPIGSEDFNFMLKHLGEFQKNVGKEEVDAFLKDAYSKILFMHVAGMDAFLMKGEVKMHSVGKRSLVGMDELKKQLSELNTPSQPALKLTYQMAEHAVNGEVGALLKEVNAHMDRLTQSDIRLLATAFEKLLYKASKEESKGMEKVSLQLASNTKGRVKANWELLAEKCESLSHVGVYFEDLTLEEALAKAKRLRKKVFVDCYTSWCGPCKRVAKDVFPQEEMGDFMNPRFVNVKYDMEKGNGVEIGKKYNVFSYPTFLILNPDGTVYHKMIGAYEMDVFLSRLQEDLRPGNALSYLERQYKEGNKRKIILTKYLNVLIRIYANEEAREVLAELWPTLSQEERTSKNYWFIFSNPRLFSHDSEYMNYLRENRDLYRKNVGKEEVNERIAEPYNRSLMSIISTGEKAKSAAVVQQAEKEIEELGLMEDQGLSFRLRLAKVILTKNQNKIMTACEKELDMLASERVPLSNLLLRYGKKATPTQRSRWIRLGREMQKIQTGYQKQILERIIVGLEPKK